MSKSPKSDDVFTHRYRVFRNRKTGEIVSPLIPIFEEDWPYKEVNPNQSIQRYMDYCKFDDLVKSKELYFRRADKFSDPLEGTLSREGLHGSSKSDVALSEIVSIDSGDYKTMKRHQDIVKRCHFVNCWHINTDQCVKMWNEYTMSPDSVMIVSTVKRLFDSLRVRPYGAAVTYISNDDPRTDLGVKSLFYYKADKYVDEREFRLLLDLGMLGESTIPEDDDADFFRKIPVDIDALIKGLTPHPDATKDTIDKVRCLLNAYMPGKFVDN